ncbi:hypothetical protein Unana1_02269 [Umbelopsis nana]
MEKEHARVAIFLPTEYERKSVQDTLIKCIAVDKHTSMETQAAAKQILLTMFSDAQMLLVDNADVPEMLQCDGAGLKLVIIEDVIRENIALPVAGYYRLQDLTRYLLQQRESALTENDMYAKWEGGEDVNVYMEGRMRTYFRIIQAFRELANDYIQNLGSHNPLFPLSPGELRFTPTLEFKSSYIGKLCFFKMLETITSYEKMRMKRFKGYGEDDEEKGGIFLALPKIRGCAQPKAKNQKSGSKVSSLD